MPGKGVKSFGVSAFSVHSYLTLILRLVLSLAARRDCHEGNGQEGIDSSYVPTGAHAAAMCSSTGNIPGESC